MYFLTLKCFNTIFFVFLTVIVFKTIFYGKFDFFGFFLLFSVKRKFIFWKFYCIFFSNYWKYFLKRICINANIWFKKKSAELAENVRKKGFCKINSKNDICENELISAVFFIYFFLLYFFGTEKKLLFKMRKLVFEHRLFHIHYLFRVATTLKVLFILLNL